MSSRKISTKIQIEGENEFRASVNAINNSLGALKNDLTKVSMEYRSSANTMDALRAKGAILNQMHTQQAERLKAITAALQSAKDAQRGYSADVEECRAKVSGAEAELQKMADSSDMTAEAQEALTAALARCNQELAAAERYNDEAQRRVYELGKQFNSAERDILKTNGDLHDNQIYMDEAAKSADGCAASLDQYGKKVREAGAATEEAGAAAGEAGGELEELGDSSLSSLEESFSDAGERLESMGGILTVGVTAPLVAAGTAAVNFASGMAESLNKVEVAFTFAAEGVKNWSDTTLTSIGLAKGTALDMAALFGDMATSMNINAASAADMSMELVNLAADLSSFKNIGIEQSLNALKGVFTGEGESLKSLGVIMTDANLKAYAMSQGYKVVYDKMDQAQKVAVRYGYILEQTKNAQGDFARTSDGTANQLRILQESLKEAASTMGNDLLPIVTPLITQLGGLVQSFAQMDEGTRKVVVQAALFAAALGPMLKLTGLLTTATATGAAVYAAYTAAKAADITVTNGAAAAQAILNVVLKDNPVGAVITAVGALVAVLGSLAIVTGLTGERQENFSQKLQATVSATNDAVSVIEEDTAGKLANLEAIKNLLPEIDALNGKHSRTAEEQSRLNALVSTANDLYPGLIGEIDGLTGSYDINTGAVYKNIEALKAKLRTEAAQDVAAEYYRSAAQLRLDLAGAEDKLGKAQTAYDEKLQACQKNLKSGIITQNDFYAAMFASEVRLSVCAGEVEELSGKIEEYEGKGAAAIDTTAGLAGETHNLGEETHNLAEETGLLGDEVRNAYTVLSDILEQVQGRYELLAKAQGEMNDVGYLSLSTVSSLLEKYPDLAGYLIQTQDGYQLAEGALQEFLAAQRTEYQMMSNEARQAALAFIDQNSREVLAIDATTDAIKRKIQAIQMEARLKASAKFAEIAGANDFGPGTSEAHMRQVIGNDVSIKMYQQTEHDAAEALLALDAAERAAQTYESVTASLGRESAAGGGGKSGKGDTEEEKRLAAFQKVMEQVEFLLDTGEITEEQYYAKLEQMRDKYLTEGSDEWRDATVKLYDYKQGAYERELAILDESLANQEITLQQHMDGLAAIQSKYLKEGTAAWRENAERQAADQKAMYDEELADTEYFHNMGIIDDREYYRQRAALRDKYLEEDSEAWRRDMEEQHKFEQQQREAFLTAARKATEDAEKRSTDLLKQFSEERIAQIKAEQQAQEDRINAEIDGINEQIDARRRLRQEESDEDAVAKAKKTLDAAQGELSYARDEFERAELEKEVQRAQEAYDKALQDKDDNDWEYAKQQEIKAKQDELEAVKDQAEKDIAGAEAYAKKRLEEYEEAAARREQREREEEDAELAQLLGSGWKHSAQRTQRAASGALSAATAQAVTQIFSSAANSVTTNHNNVTMSMPTAPLTSWQLAQGIKKAFDAMESK